jgi:hypothetical protein
MRSSVGSVTHVLGQLKDEDPAAIRDIWKKENRP